MIVFTIPYEPEGVELFWSLTRYSAITRNTIPGKNDLFNAYNTKPDASGNITVTFSVEDPEDGTYWMPMNAGEPYYFVIRYYKPDVNNLPQKLLTHKSPQMTQRYAHLGDETLRNASDLAGEIIGEAMKKDDDKKVIEISNKK